MTHFLFFYFLAVVSCHLTELKQGDHLHVSVQFLHQDVRFEERM